MTTITETRVGVVRLYGDLSYEGKLEELRSLSGIFAEWGDPLSIRINKWCRKVLSVKPEDALTAEGTLNEEAQRKINKLAYKLLVNSIDRAPLRDPVLIRGVVLESWMLEEFRMSLGFFPLDGGSLEGAPHVFARALTEWVRPLAVSSEVGMRTVLVPLEEGEPEALMLRGALLMQLAFQEQATKRELATQKALHKLAISQAEQSVALRGEQAEALRLAQARQEAITAELGRVIKRQKALHDGTADLLKVRIEGVEKKAEALSVDLAASKKQEEILAAEAASLRAQLNSAYAQVRELANRPAPDSDDGCAIL